MANFIQAKKWLREGKKVRRKIWKDESYWKLGVDESIESVGAIQAHIHLNQFEAKDWEIKDEKESKEKEIMNLMKVIKDFLIKNKCLGINRNIDNYYIIVEMEQTKFPKKEKNGR